MEMNINVRGCDEKHLSRVALTPAARVGTHVLPMPDAPNQRDTKILEQAAVTEACRGLQDLHSVDGAEVGTAP